MFNLDDYITSNGVRKYTSIGCYPLYYVTADGGVLSPAAVEENLALCRDPDDKQWFVVGADANWENPSLYCDHTSERIESAYADDETEDAAQTLSGDVRIWVDRCFDHIPLRVAEKLTDDALYEHIDLSDYDENDDGEPPYPMCGTLFHYRERGHEGFVEAAKKAGFIVIEGVPEFDGVMLGVQGAGYSFYDSHWIILYVALFGEERTS